MIVLVLGALAISSTNAGRVAAQQTRPLASSQAVDPPQTLPAAPEMPNGEVLIRIALGFLLASAGAAALVIAAAYRGASLLTVASFGLFSLFYGTLILIQIPAIDELLGLRGRARGYAIFWVSYFVPGLGLLYAEQTRGRGWFSLLRRFWQIGLPLAFAFVLWDVMRGRPGAAFPVYQAFLLLSMLVLLPHVVLFQSDDRVERLARTLGTGMLALTLVIDLLSRYLSWPGVNDTYGIALFVLAQGVLTARQFFKDQRDLAAVEQELTTARSIQTSILPRELPRAHGLAMAVRNIPAHSVAGDLYDFMPVDDTHVGVLVADVAGHGVSAALIASMTTVAFASQRAHAADTARTLTEMNRVLCGHFDTRYVTAAYAFIDTAAKRLRYSLGGHPPPLLWRAKTKTVEKLANGSIVLGLIENATFTACEVVVETGDRLILYTDGLTELENRAGAFFGDHELVSFISSHSNSNPEAFVDGLIGHLSAWSGRLSTGNGNVQFRFDDDLTLVVVDFVD